MYTYRVAAAHELGITKNTKPVRRFCAVIEHTMILCIVSVETHLKSTALSKGVAL